MKLGYSNILYVAVLALIAVSCTNEAEPQLPDPDEGRETSVVDITLSIGDSWDIDFDETRAAPPTNTTDINKDSYSEIANIDSVKVFTFRRKEGSDGEFYRDKKNEKTLPVLEETIKSDHDSIGTSHTHRIAKGSITKTYGYEYRVIAVAYPTRIESHFSNSLSSYQFNDDVNSWMSITIGDTFSSFYAKLMTWDCSGWTDYAKTSKYEAFESNTVHINKQILQTPQFFYGTLLSQNSKSDIIPYSEIDTEGNMNSNIGLTGILMRGVAKVDIKFEYINPSNEVHWIIVLAEKPNTKVDLTSYDDFLNPSEPLDIKCNEIGYRNENTYTALAYIPISDPNDSFLTQSTYTETFYILPCKTKLAIRVRSGTTITYLRNGQLKGNAVESHGNNGTGIVSPDFDGEEFYFRRNHKYTITVSNPMKIVQDYEFN